MWLKVISRCILREVHLKASWNFLVLTLNFFYPQLCCGVGMLFQYGCRRAGLHYVHFPLPLSFSPPPPPPLNWLLGLPFSFICHAFFLSINWMLRDDLGFWGSFILSLDLYLPVVLRPRSLRVCLTLSRHL